jgi:two-component system, LytTR family, sensor kinase
MTRIVLIIACDLAIWLLAGLFATSEFYRRSVVMGGGNGVEWDQVLDVQICTALIWAACTPFVVLLARALPLRPPRRVRNAIAIAVFIPYLAVVRAAVGGIINDLGEHEPVSWHMIDLSIGIRTHRNIAILAVIVFVTNLVDLQREAAERERQGVRAQTLLARTELDELRTRLQPRFALHMLRHIASVIRDEPRTADALIVNLSGILRRSMSRGGGERVPLADELEHLDRCLELCRAGGRFNVSARYVASDDVLACRVPALVLQPLIESAVIDLTSGNGGSVEVRCSRDGDQLCVELANATLRIPYEEAPA